MTPPIFKFTFAGLYYLARDLAKPFIKLIFIQIPSQHDQQRKNDVYLKS
jgi:hypothetical protein